MISILLRSLLAPCLLQNLQNKIKMMIVIMASFHSFRVVFFRICITNQRIPRSNLCVNNPCTKLLWTMLQKSLMENFLSRKCRTTDDLQKSQISGLCACHLRPAHLHFSFFCYETMFNCSQNCWIDWNSAVLCFQ